MSRKSEPRRRAERVVRYVRADGTEVEKRYPAWQPVPGESRPKDTIEDLLEAWQRSPRWRKLAPSTQRTYATACKHLRGIHRVPVREITRRHLLDMRDGVVESHGMGAANSFVTVLSLIFNFAVDYEWIEHPPTARLRRDLEMGEIPPWSLDEFALAVRHLPERLRRAVVLAAYTGQRRGDLIKMGWADYDGRAIRVVQQKSQGAVKLTLPVPPPLKLELDRWRPAVVDLRGTPVGTILLTDAGVPWRGGNLSVQMMNHLNKVPGFPEGKNMHGLRKLAAASLAQAGCSVHEIMAITGHRTLAMVELYTRSVEQAQAAEAAMAKLTAWHIKIAS